MLSPACAAFLVAACSAGPAPGARKGGSAEGGGREGAGPETAVPILDASLDSAEQGWLALEDGRLLLTADGGSRWAEITRFDGSVGIDFVSAAEGWACREGRLLRTADGGATWQLVAEDLARAGFEEPLVIDFVDGRRGYLSDPNGVFQTADGGRTWTRVSAHLCAEEEDVRTYMSFVNHDTVSILCGFDNEAQPGGRLISMPPIPFQTPQWQRTRSR